VGSDGPDLVDEVLHACDAELSEGGRDDLVVSEGDSGAVDLTAASLVDESLDGGSGGVSIGDERLDHADHVDGGTVKSDEHSVVELSETEEVHDLLGLGGKLVDTSSSDDKGNLGLGLNVEVAGGFSVTLGLDGSGISGGVLVLVLLGFGGEVFAGLDTLGLGFGTSLDGGVVEDLVAGLLLEDVFGDGSCH